ncbi:hypothetical protein Xen7305DRAFT_00024630 [Xenococcus sp. PCC 7305]|nr:hypothetical protein Xen7305DRAFT_00024630 [Xenococcus sp. PCC 7305]
MDLSLGTAIVWCTIPDYKAWRGKNYNNLTLHELTKVHERTFMSEH